MTKKKVALPKREMAKALSNAADAVPAEVVACLLETAGNYKLQRAKEAIVAGDANLALVLLALHVATISNDAKQPE